MARKNPTISLGRFSVLIAGLWSITTLHAAVSQVGSPEELQNVRTITFDEVTNLATLNTTYPGITFSRDDGAVVFASDWTALGRSTVSPDNVLATIVPPWGGIPWATHLNVSSPTPLYAIGGYFGNDHSAGAVDFHSCRLSVYGAANKLLGSVSMPVNGNISVDQFLGLRSDRPFFRARFENLNSSGNPTSGYSVALDNLVFTSVPQPQISVRAIRRLLFEFPPGSGIGSSPAGFLLRRHGDTNQSLVVNFEVGGTAEEGSDYIRTDFDPDPGTIVTGRLQTAVFQPGQEKLYVIFQNMTDQIKEPAEFIRLEVVPPREGAAAYGLRARHCATVWTVPVTCARAAPTPAGHNVCQTLGPLKIPPGFFTTARCR